jgi:hypothetical protein
MSWRITYVEDPAVLASIKTNHEDGGVLVYNKKLIATSRIEIRDNDGQVFRLGVGADFELIDSPYGVRPHFRGPVFLGPKGSCAKARVSCWLVPVPQFERPDIFVETSPDESVEKYYALRGSFSIIEFDDSNKPFHICHVEEGSVAEVKNNPALLMRQRYSVLSNSAFNDSEYQKILDNYLDIRRWR